MPTLDWIGKKAVVNHHRQVPYRLLHCDNKTISIIRDPMGIYRAFSILLILIILPPMAGCGTQTSKRERYAVPVPMERPFPVERGIKLQAPGYAIQVGAFAKMDNAVRLSAVLAGKGVDAYYLKDRDGLFKVRFGDFRKKEEARVKVEEFLSEGTIEDYLLRDSGCLMKDHQRFG